MSALALDIVGRALFGSDLTGEADQMGRAMDAGQRVAMLATFLPLRVGPASTRALKAVARRVGHTPRGSRARWAGSCPGAAPRPARDSGGPG